MSAHLASKTLCMLAKLMPQADFNLFVSRVRDYFNTKKFGELHRVCIFKWGFHDCSRTQTGGAEATNTTSVTPLCAGSVLTGGLQQARFFSVCGTPLPED
ncbi:retrotransposon hot spot (RHS) protein [Trypanosoma cruzi]|nr:retrotransposon hot spot (RHS) protein [Trypanosoma cruzi]